MHVGKALRLEGADNGKILYTTDAVLYHVDRTRMIGEGTFRRCFKARIAGYNDMVAKVNKTSPLDLGDYKRDAQTYEGFRLILNMFKHQAGAVIPPPAMRILDRMRESTTIPLLRPVFKRMLTVVFIQMVKNFILEGREDGELAIYFVEERISGRFVKYCSNADFICQKPDNIRHRLLATLCHWSYQYYEGSRMVGDIQGSGDLLMDVQMININTEWSSGNCYAKAFDAFRSQHQCNEFCKLLNLTLFESSVAPALSRQ